MGEAKRRRDAAETAGQIFTAKDGTFLWKDDRHKPSPCPYCGAPLDTATSPEGCSLVPGAWTVCLICTQILKYNNDLTLRAATTTELKQLDDTHPPFANKMRMMQRAAQLVNRRDLPSYG